MNITESNLVGHNQGNAKRKVHCNKCFYQKTGKLSGKRASHISEGQKIIPRLQKKQIIKIWEEINKIEIKNNM